jgi:CobQ-like glutamine amidotransferase family enzyme
MTGGIRITRLYPGELDLPGDRGNIEALQLRARRAGLDVDYRTHAIGDGPIEPTDLLVLGTGPASVIDRVLDDARGRRDDIAAIIGSHTPVLAIGTGAEILSQSITTLDGTTREALGLLPFTMSSRTWPAPSRSCARRRPPRTITRCGSSTTSR